ncbi:MAG: hypothetical protein KME54_29745 [Tolypothrix brevis GSE-NOS-MK-07-07A]|jgi:hypothetical protein|nr:hypothetical protein [Tolypothrix brevis GSE-NOS-MK-07-07A]
MRKLDGRFIRTCWEIFHEEGERGKGEEIRLNPILDKRSCRDAINRVFDGWSFNLDI